MEIAQLINQIIPPSDWQHREGFTNMHIIDQLSYSERLLVESLLMEKLIEKKSADTLIVETLAYMKSTKSLPVFNNLLITSPDNFVKLIIATSIFKISLDYAMVDIAIDLFLTFNDKYQKIPAFVYLKSFNDNKTDAFIKKYINDPDYLISYNAKRHLGLN
ncbi:hypothetical protein PQ469_19030 [Mucilaginibacter sp. KACC 22773]|uniref:hypothetical protein n=1 Tax=Mucilaginibacter sp. KACC 22773 TaxID=3025671 RepID=UPI0023664F47|nr:hypothetical protein [Mucilaginibacter sp. KACC 22773]WDF75986.1 hypothetical protein PQ469_19030 [Mucilaginibacter sp. KACC 22773]